MDQTASKVEYARMDAVDLQRLEEQVQQLRRKHPSGRLVVTDHEEMPISAVIETVPSEGDSEITFRMFSETNKELGRVVCHFTAGVLTHIMRREPRGLHLEDVQPSSLAEQVWKRLETDKVLAARSSVGIPLGFICLFLLFGSIGALWPLIREMLHQVMNVFKGAINGF